MKFWALVCERGILITCDACGVPQCGLELAVNDIIISSPRVENNYYAIL
jgi:hypothetical protein